MKREQKSKKLVVLGTASRDTLGPAIVGNSELHGFYTIGLSDQ